MWSIISLRSIITRQIYLANKTARLPYQKSRNGSLFSFVAAPQISAEQEGDAPQAGNTDDGIDDPADYRILATKDPGDKVKLENTHQAPVDATDDGQKLCQSIQHNEFPPFFIGMVLSFPCVEFLFFFDWRRSFYSL